METILRQLARALNRPSRVSLQFEAAREELVGVLVFLFAIRLGTWAIALILVAVGDLPEQNSQHEPLLLAITFVQTLVAILYVPLLRPRVRNTLGLRWRPRHDLIALAMVDMAAVMAILYVSGGWRSPYYHFAVSSLLVPAFLFGWRRSALLLVAFLGAYTGIIATAGLGTDGPWLNDESGSLAGVFMTPALVVAVVQYLSWLARRLSEQREQARRAFHETAALYSIAQIVAASDEPRELVARVVDALKGLGRFQALTVFSLAGSGELSPQVGFGDWESVLPNRWLPPTEQQMLSHPEVELDLATVNRPTEMALAVPIHVQDHLWGVMAFRAASSRSEQADLRLVRAVSRQLSLGLTKIALHHQKEELAAQEERSRIAREIHDGIAQSIYMLALNLEKAADVASDDAKLSQRMVGLVTLAKEALLEVRHYIFDLKPLLAGEAGLTSTIQGQIREFSTISGLPVQFEVQGEEHRVSLAVGSSLYRIVQEALANVYRHANASAIDIQLAFHKGSVSLEVRDNGCGFIIDNGHLASLSGRGLRNIYQRVSELGGQVDIVSAPGQGTKVRVTLPVAEAERRSA